MHMATQEVLHGLIEEELQIQSARPGQGHHKAGQLPLRPAHQDGTKAGPIDLAFLGGEDLEAQEGLARLRAQAGHHAPQLFHAAGVPTVANHLMDAGGAQPGVLFQGLTHEGQERIQDRGAQGLGMLEPFHFDGVLPFMGIPGPGLKPGPRNLGGQTG
jgi:hypothetical protein